MEVCRVFSNLFIHKVAAQQLQLKFNEADPTVWLKNTSLLYLKDAFDSLQLGVFSFIAVQLPVRIADQLQQPLSLNVPQNRVLQSTAVFRQRL